MSSFSSVVQKPGKKIVPKAAPRRNITRKLAQVPTPASSLSEAEEQALDTRAEINASNPFQTLEDEPPDVREEVSAANRESAYPTAVNKARSGPHTIPTVNVLQPPTTSDRRGGSENAVQLTGAEAEREILANDLTHYNVDSVSSRSLMKAPSIRTDQTACDQSVSAIAPGTSGSPEQPSQQAAVSEGSTTQSQRRLSSSSRVVDSPSPRKRVKPNPKLPTQSALTHTTDTVTSTQIPSPQPTIRRVVDDSHLLLEDLLQSATRRAANVSELANSISSHLRSSNSQDEAQAVSYDGHDAEAEQSDTSIAASPLKKRSRRRKELERQAAEVVANALKKNTASTRKRGPTPENAEEYELEPENVRMGDLCEDSKLGKKSALEAEMQANWPEILQRRKEDRERALEQAAKRQRRSAGQKYLLNASQEPVAALAPAMAVVNGIIVVDQASREIDRAAQLQQAAALDLDNVREDKDYYKYVNQNTVGNKPGHGSYAKWDEEANERFFKGLRMFGTDFLMIANMFPGLTRKQIKTKFIREENADKARVQECLRNREPVQLTDYAEMANKQSEEFHTLDSLQKELDEQEQKLRDEDNERRKREGFIAAGDSEAADQPGTEGTDNVTDRATESIEPGRFDAVTQAIVEAAAGSKKRQRKTNTANSRRGARANRRPEGGIEEVLGSITEVAV